MIIKRKSLDFIVVFVSVLSFTTPQLHIVDCILERLSLFP